MRTHPFVINKQSSEENSRTRDERRRLHDAFHAVLQERDLVHRLLERLHGLLQPPIRHPSSARRLVVQVDLHCGLVHRLDQRFGICTTHKSR